MPRLYDDIGKYGAASQGKPARASKAGTCTVCGHRYPKGHRVLQLGGGNGTHPDCAYSDLVVSYLP